MGQMLVRQVGGTAGAKLAGGSEAPGHAALGADIAANAGGFSVYLPSAFHFLKYKNVAVHPQMEGVSDPCPAE